MIHRIYSSIFGKWRKRRIAQFRSAFPITPHSKIIDVGGNWWNWTDVNILSESILCINLIAPSPLPPAGKSKITQNIGNALNLPFPDGQFDIAFSNSVIEHVGSLEDQQTFASEIRRVGRNLWIQTPALECPIEPHYLTPIIHWIPGPIGRFLKKYLSLRSLIQGPNHPEIRDLIASTRLLSKSEFQKLFPDCTVETERLFLIFPKSYIAIRHR